MPPRTPASRIGDALALESQGAVKVHGLQEIDKMLKGFEQKVRKRILRRAAKRAGAYLLEKQRNATPVGTRHSVVRGKVYPPGLLKKSYKSRIQIRAPWIRAQVINTAFHAYWVETGHKRVDGSEEPAQPFMREVVDEEQETIVRMILTDLRAGLEKEFKRKARAAAK